MKSRILTVTLFALVATGPAAVAKNQHHAKAKTPKPYDETLNPHQI